MEGLRGQPWPVVMRKKSIMAAALSDIMLIWFAEM